MQHSRFLRHVLAAGGLVASGLVSACSDSVPTGSSEVAAVAAANPVALLTADDVIIPGVDIGAFANAVVANESGWTTTEFWDNPSNDGPSCNVGYWALGTMPVGCLYEAAGSTANQGGYTKYWGNGPENRKTSSFMFNGGYAYRVTLLGSYAAEVSEIGYFTVSGGVYTFTKLWDTKAIGNSVIIPPTGGLAWGIYLKHDGHGGTGTCALDTDCSNATGDMHTGVTPTQQFALFTNAGETSYLVGVEDNDEAQVGLGDDDFQDYILSVQPLEVPMFVIGDVEPHAVGEVVNFWGAQWWKNNAMSGPVSSGVASFKGYATNAGNFCGDSWTTLPGNSSNPPATIPDVLAVIVTSTVQKDGSAISGTIREIVIVDQDGGYGPNPGHAGRGEVTRIVCTVSNGGGI